MKAIYLDWNKFTWLQRLLAVIDLILNPRASNYPFLNSYEDIELPKRHIAVKSFTKDNVRYYWCIRWL